MKNANSVVCCVVCLSKFDLKVPYVCFLPMVKSKEKKEEKKFMKTIFENQIKSHNTQAQITLRTIAFAASQLPSLEPCLDFQKSVCLTTNDLAKETDDLFGKLLF